MSSLEHWDYGQLLSFKHHFVAGERPLAHVCSLAGLRLHTRWHCADGLNGHLPCDAAVFDGWSGSAGPLPPGWHEGVDWSTVKPRQEDAAAGFWGFGAKVDWGRVGTNGTQLLEEVVGAYQAYFYEAFAAIQSASEAVPMHQR